MISWYYADLETSLVGERETLTQTPGHGQRVYRCGHMQGHTHELKPVFVQESTRRRTRKCKEGCRLRSYGGANVMPLMARGARRARPAEFTGICRARIPTSSRPALNVHGQAVLFHTTHAQIERAATSVVMSSSRLTFVACDQRLQSGARSWKARSDRNVSK